MPIQWKWVVLRNHFYQFLLSLLSRQRVAEHSIFNKYLALGCLNSDVRTSGMYQTLEFKHRRVPIAPLRCMNVDWHPMVSEVGIFQVAEVPMNWYKYTIPIIPYIQNKGKTNSSGRLPPQPPPLSLQCEEPAHNFTGPT